MLLIHSTSSSFHLILNFILLTFSKNPELKELVRIGDSPQIRELSALTINYLISDKRTNLIRTNASPSVAHRPSWSSNNALVEGKFRTRQPA